MKIFRGSGWEDAWHSLTRVDVIKKLKVLRIFWNLCKNKFSSDWTEYIYIYFHVNIFLLNFFDNFSCYNDFQGRSSLGRRDFPHVAVELRGFWTLVGYTGSVYTEQNVGIRRKNVAFLSEESSNMKILVSETKLLIKVTGRWYYHFFSNRILFYIFFKEIINKYNTVIKY